MYKLLCFCLLFITFESFGQNKLPPTDNRWIEQDFLSPTTKNDGHTSKALSSIYISTDNLDSIKKFYCQGMGMDISGPIKLSKKQQKSLAIFWGISKNKRYDIYTLERKSIDGEVKIFVINYKSAIAKNHQSYSPYELGPFSIGFPNLDQHKLDARMKALNIECMAPLQSNKVPRPDGQLYSIDETIFKGPDFVHGVGIHRGNGMRQVAVVDSITKFGGPGYYAMVAHNADTIISFYKNILDLEIRSDRPSKSGPGSALGIEEGVPFRFTIMYPHGARTGQALILDFEDDVEVSTNQNHSIEKSGIVMVSYQANDLIKVMDQCKKYKYHFDHIAKHPLNGDCTGIKITMPEGFFVEVYGSKNIGS